LLVAIVFTIAFAFEFPRADNLSMMSIAIPPLLARHCAKTAERSSWLAALPKTVRRLQERWGVSLESPFDHAYVSCSWVAPATLADGTPAVLKIGMPHMESEQETEGLRFWDGDATVRLLESDNAANAMLLERCEPGTPLLSLPETEQDVIIAAMLQRLRRKPPPGKFRPLSALVVYWSEQTCQHRERWPDAALVSEGLRTFAALAAETSDDVLLATDLHAGNVLQAQREPWLLIDPKPFVGDAAYDLTQHLLNCEKRLQADAPGLIRRTANLAGVDAERVRMWLFARAAAEPRDNWHNWKMKLARTIRNNF
jgi:streptomycin 6-kinase